QHHCYHNKYYDDKTLVLQSFLAIFTDPATTEIYTLSLHDALPISFKQRDAEVAQPADLRRRIAAAPKHHQVRLERNDALQVECRSEEHTSELQSPYDLVCRLLLEKKKS